MKAKAIKDLNQLSDNNLFEEISEGLELVIEHASHIEGELKFLADHKKACGYRILKAIVEEEAAKFLILMDAIRCTRVPPDDFTKQLIRFNDHLAKGIYSYVYRLKPQNFAELREIIRSECHEYYLDGPNDVDWIFRNEILQKREEAIYVDYIESDGGHHWLSPKRYYHPSLASTTFYLKPQALEVADALWKTGCCRPEALSIIAKKWRAINMHDDFSWQELRKLNRATLEALKNKGLLKEQPEKIYSIIIDKWLFPLYSINIRIITVDKEKLKEKREERFFAMYY